MENEWELNVCSLLATARFENHLFICSFCIMKQPDCTLSSYFMSTFINLDSMVFQINIHNSPTIFFLNSYPLKAISFLLLINLLGQQTIFISTNVWIFFAISSLESHCIFLQQTTIISLVICLILFGSFTILLVFHFSEIIILNFSSYYSLYLSGLPIDLECN